MSDTNTDLLSKAIASTVSAPVLLLLSSAVGAAEPVRFEGQLDGFGGPTAGVLAGTMTPIKVGEVDEDGQFTLVLDDSFKEKSLAAVEEQNAGDSGWSVELATIERAFGCNGDGVDTSGGEQVVVSLLGDGWLLVGNLEEQVLHGRFAAADSRAFAEAQGAWDADTIPGWSVDWYYFENPASVQGSCTGEMYAYNQSDSYEMTTEYALDFKPGWNLVRYQIHSVYEDPDGPDQYTRASYETLDALPEGVTFPFVEDNR